MSKRAATRTAKAPAKASAKASAKTSKTSAKTSEAPATAPKASAKTSKAPAELPAPPGRGSGGQRSGSQRSGGRGNGRTETVPRKPPRTAAQARVRTRAPRRRSARTPSTGRLQAAIRGIPTTAWICALVAVLNCVSWSIVTPPLQGPDEQAHYAYVQQLAENSSMPSGSAEENFSPEETTALRDLEFGEVVLDPRVPSLPTRARRNQLLHDLSQPGLSHKGDGSVGVAASEPPLYYALETIPYELGSGGTLMMRLELMRLLSALLTGVTVLFVFFFLREALPAVPWAWTVGTLGAALSPLLGFVGGSLDPDALLFAVCAALFYVLARAFRRGFEKRMAIAIGGAVAIGLVTKVNFVAVLAGVAVGLVLLTIREARISRRDAYRALALAGGIALSPALLYLAMNLARHRELLGIVSGSIKTTEHHKIPDELAYIWQFYLPRLPGMPQDHPGIVPLWHVWFKGAVARYNWLETAFPGFVYKLAVIPAVGILGLCARELYVVRRPLRQRTSELATYAVMLLGLMVLLAAASFDSFPILSMADCEPRYFLPMLALGGAVLALAARGAGRRWGPVAGVAIVMVFFAHNVLSQLLEVSRFYHPV